MRATFIKNLSFAFFLGILFAGPALAIDDTPTTVKGAKVVSTEEVVKALADGVMIIDTRVASEYANGHIKGAISLPYRSKSRHVADFDDSRDQFKLSKLPADKTKQVIIYCMGVKCWKSYKATVVAVKAGYTNIGWYRAGLPEWKTKGHPVE
jgi:rhodanese-related sulfurtransferase